MSLLFGYRVDVAKNEFDDVFKVVIVIYLYFENKFDILRHQISANDYEETQSRNMEFLKYFEGERGSKNRLELQGVNLPNLRSKALLTGVWR